MQSFFLSFSLICFVNVLLASILSQTCDEHFSHSIHVANLLLHSIQVFEISFQKSLTSLVWDIDRSRCEWKVKIIFSHWWPSKLWSKGAQTHDDLRSKPENGTSPIHVNRMSSDGHQQRTGYNHISSVTVSSNL